ncbi:MAG TPA: hypothetical protein PLQ89_07490, partial [Phycisphaerae bacterium]|nr:hypothetical protein [Phycisphaerae bacterium]
MKPVKKTVHKQPSFQLKSTTVEAYVTEQGGHLAPVVFDRQGCKIQPFSVAPWAEERPDPSLPQLLKVLRGDFFCMPFGGNDQPFKGEKFPAHGETANNRWTFESLEKDDGRTTLHLSMKTSVRKGRVDKRISVIDGHNAVYSQHVISQMSGPMNLGHHATLKFPDEPGSGYVTFSPYRFGQVFIEPTERPEERGYSILKPGYEFKDHRKVATITGEFTDLSRYPARRGFEDIVQIVADAKRDVAWTAVSFPRQRYVWFALKDPKVLAGTVMWMSNGGRHYAPWNGRHVSVMGLEEITGYFHIGIAASAKKNPFNDRGVPTVLKLNPAKPT